VEAALLNEDFPAEAVNLMKQRLLLASVSTNLWKDAAKPPSYRDITSAMVRDATALTAASLAKTANSLLIAMQELRLWHAHKPPYHSMKAAFASNGKSLQELLRSRCAAAAKDGDH
jgi:hypothetical protein